MEKEFSELVKSADNSKISNIDNLLNDQANETYERSLRVIKLENKYNKLREYLSG